MGRYVGREVGRKMGRWSIPPITKLHGWYACKFNASSIVYKKPVTPPSLARYLPGQHLKSNTVESQKQRTILPSQYHHREFRDLTIYEQVLLCAWMAKHQICCACSFTISDISRSVRSRVPRLHRGSWTGCR